jgi:3-methyladenine DNA glycosylase AlkD
MGGKARSEKGREIIRGRVRSPGAATVSARRLIAARARPIGAFDFSRYFRDAGGLAFYNTGMSAVREVAREVARANADWTVGDATAFADIMIRDRYLEVKAVGVAVLARYRRRFTPGLLHVWKQWLARDYASNWATTDDICGNLIGPLLEMRPELVPVVAAWCRHRNLWVRRASAVGLLRSIRRGVALDEAYEVARALHADNADLIEKAVGWMLREAGKVDSRRLERYLITNGPSIPRTTVRYAIERFPDEKRRTLLRATAGIQ